MKYHVIITTQAAVDLKSAARWWGEHRSAEQAERWYDDFCDAIFSLQSNPLRCSLAREHSAFPYEVRQLAFGLGRTNTHRAVFTVRDDRVIVLRIRHLAQADLSSLD